MYLEIQDETQYDTTDCAAGRQCQGPADTQLMLSLTCVCVCVCVCVLALPSRKAAGHGPLCLSLFVQLTDNSQITQSIRQITAALQIHEQTPCWLTPTLSLVLSLCLSVPLCLPLSPSPSLYFSLSLCVSHSVNSIFHFNFN